MNKKTIGLLYGLYLLFASCSSHERTIVTQFTNEIVLNAKVISVPPILFLPEALFIVNDYLIVMQPQKDTIFNVFHLPECAYLYSGGTKGGGPNEFVQPYSNFVSVSKSDFKIIDAGLFVKTIHMNNNTFLINNTKRITNNDQLINGMVELNNSTYCILNCISADKEYLMVDTAGVETAFSNYPKLTPVNSAEEGFSIYFKYLVAPPIKKDKFAAFYNSFKFIRYYDINGNLLKEIDVNINPSHTSITYDIRDRYIYYYKPVATERYIYALCMNKTDRALENDLESMNMEIQVWDWNGKPVMKYILDKPFTVFTVSSDDKTLYASSFFVEDEIFVFDMIH